MAKRRRKRMRIAREHKPGSLEHAVRLALTLDAFDPAADALRALLNQGLREVNDLRRDLRSSPVITVGLVGKVRVRIILSGSDQKNVVVEVGKEKLFTTGAASIRLVQNIRQSEQKAIVAARLIERARRKQLTMLTKQGIWWS